VHVPATRKCGLLVKGTKRLCEPSSGRAGDWSPGRQHFAFIRFPPIRDRHEQIERKILRYRRSYNDPAAAGAHGHDLGRNCFANAVQSQCNRGNQ